MAASSEPDYRKLLKVTGSYQKSMFIILKAMKFDEEGNEEAAIHWYLKGLEVVSDGLSVEIGGAAYNGQEWSDARNQQEKMRVTQARTKERLHVLQQCSTSQQFDIQNTTNVPPQYAEDVPEGHSSLSTSPTDEADDQYATTELLVIPGGVQIFFVSEDQKVGTIPPTYPSFLKVLVRNSTERVFLQVLDWKYPLIAGQTPVLKTNSGVYLFPNLTTNTISLGSVGIVISTEIDQRLIKTFEDVLENLAVFSKQKQEDETDTDDGIGMLHLDELVKPSTSDKIVSGIEKSAKWLSSGLSKGADYTTGLVQQGSNKLKDKLIPNNDPAQINPTIQKGLYYTHEASRATVKVSSFLVSGLCAITSKVGEELGPRIKKKLLPESTTDTDGQNESTVDGVFKVAGAGISGFATVFTELEKSGLAIAQAVSSAAVENVEFKYGKDAGIATSYAMGSVVNVGKTAFNLDNLGMKAIAKRAAKDTSKAIFMDCTTKGVKGTTGSAV